MINVQNPKPQKPKKHKKPHHHHPKQQPTQPTRMDGEGNKEGLDEWKEILNRMRRKTTDEKVKRLSNSGSKTSSNRGNRNLAHQKWKANVQILTIYLDNKK